MDFDMDYDAGSMDVEESDVSDTFDDVSDEGYEESELDVMLDGIQDDVRNVHGACIYYYHSFPYFYPVVSYFGIGFGA